MTQPKKPSAPAKKPSDSDRIDAIIRVLEENGISLGHHDALK